MKGWNGLKQKLQRYISLFLGFILGIKGGYIALWTEDQPEKAQVFPYKASSLPPEDQKALEKGIYIENEQKLRRLLEDYLS